MAHAWRFHRGEGLAFFGALLWLGLVRETCVALYHLLYGFAPLTLMLGKAPLLAAVIWGFSIYAAGVWTEAMGWGSVLEKRPERRPGGSGSRVGLFLGAAVFMVALACFYEPFLGRLGMARWEPGTRATLGVPWIALVGYPTLTVPVLALWMWLRRRTGVARWAWTLAGLAVLALAHAWGLQALKDGLSW